MASDWLGPKVHLHNSLGSFLIGWDRRGGCGVIPRARSSGLRTFPFWSYPVGVSYCVGNGEQGGPVWEVLPSGQVREPSSRSLRNV